MKKALFITFSLVILAMVAIGVAVLSPYQPYIRQYLPTGFYRPIPSAPDNLAEKARLQIGVTLKYDSAYEKLAYPGGDIPIERGVCTDVVIRALRLKGFDLQQAVHEDMSRDFAAYPKNWGAKRPDKNIDHRRVPNLQVYFKRRGWSLPVTENPSDYKPGDIVTCRTHNGRPHIMIVSNRADLSGTPMVIHNMGNGTRENPQLFTFPLTGHYRIPLD